MLTALLIVLLLLPIFLLWDKSKRINNEKLINDIKSSKGKTNPELQKKIYDEFDAELAPILDIVDPNANVGLVVKELRDKYEPGVRHDIVPESTYPDFLRTDNYLAVLQYSWYKHNIRDIQFEIQLIGWSSRFKHGREFETPEEILSNLKERKIKVSTKLMDEAFSDMENKHEWFMDRYNKKCRDTWFSIYGEETKVNGVEPVLFFAGEEIYEVIPKTRIEIGHREIPNGIYVQQQKLSREDFATFLVDHPDIWCSIKKVTEFFEDCPLLPPLLPKRIIRKYRTLRQRIMDSGDGLVRELNKIYDCTAIPKLKSYGITELSKVKLNRKYFDEI